MSSQFPHTSFLKHVKKEKKAASPELFLKQDVIETDSHDQNRITSTLSNKLRHVAMSELADRNLLPLIYTVLQAERIGEEFKHAVWVWKGGMFWLHCGAFVYF